MKRWAFALLAVIVSTVSHAGMENSGWWKITTLHSGYGVKRLNIYLEGDIPNPAGCNGDGAQIDEDAPHFELISSMAMAALMAKNEVLLYIATDKCSLGGMRLIRSMRVR